MAKQVSEILVKLGIQGAEGLDKLKSSFRELEKAIGPSNATIEKARRSIIEFGDASDRTEQLIRGQLEAFKGLRGQAEIGSATYGRLVNSIAQLETELKGSSAAIDSQREAILRSSSSSKQSAESFQRQIIALKELQRQTRPGSSAFAQLGKDIDTARGKLTGLSSEAQEFSRALNQGFGATPEKLSGQIAALRRGMVGLRFDSEKYLEALERIRLMTITQAGRTGRAEVIAGFQAYQSPTFAGGYASPGRLPDLPNTTAALEQQLSELTAELANVERGSARYVDVANRMADIQRQLRSELTGTAEAFRKLDIAQAGVERRSEKLAGIQEYYRTQGPLAPGVGGYRDPATGAMIMRGARTPGRIRVEESAYPAPIGPQAFPEAGRRAQEQIQRSLNDVNRIYEEARIRRVEIQSKYDQIHIDKLLEGLDLEGQVRDKGFRDELAAFDRQLEARDRRRRRRLTAGQAVQAAGAVISGGIFGGPEGFVGGGLGAVIGSAVPGLGTVGGAFAGAAVGAQVGMIRQQAGAIGEYVAQLNLAKTTLAQAASSQDEYNQLLQLARSVSNDYAVALKPSIEGLAQIAVAARANNLTFTETEAIYRGVIASGVAFGKSQQDLDALIRATTQVLSKGKVSAEEMSGQIGERLPGAVAKFAAATDRTLPELAKAFEQGEVTIADFVKFATGQFEEYNDIAQLIAEGPEKAGVRLQIALDNASENFGGFFQQTGSGLQDFLTNMINWVNENSQQIKQFVTNWVNAGAAIANVLSKLLNAFGRTFQRISQFIQANPFFGLSKQIFGGIANATGVSKIFQQGRFTTEDLFPQFEPKQFGGSTTTTAGGDVAGDSAASKAAADKAAKEEERIQARIRDLKMEAQATLQIAALRGRIAEAEIAENRQLVARLRGIEREQQILVRYQQDIADVTDERLKKAIEIKALAELEMAGIETAIDMEKQRLAIIKEQNDEIFKRAGFRPEDKMRGGAGAFDPSLPDLRVSPGEQQMAKYREELEALTSPINAAVTGANAIGDAFGQAFQSVMTGAESAQQALSDAFKAIGEAFIQMAAEIIAKQLAMIAFQAILRAFGGGGGSFGFSGAGPAQLPSGAGFAQGFSMPSLLNAKGNVYAENGIQPFATGGIVTRPTFFKYAKGGEMQNGLMGEAGPEAIMPLKRGADGKLGVAAKLDGAMGRYRRSPGSAGGPEGGGATAEMGADGVAGMQPIDVRYSVERINNVDYVTADQFRAGMAQAAQQGAIQGERRAMRTLTNSAAARGRLGI
jgi:tape measure domain-containing protein